MTSAKDPMWIVGTLYNTGWAAGVSAVLRRSGTDGFILSAHADDGRGEYVSIEEVSPPIAGAAREITISGERTFIPQGEIPKGFLRGHEKRAYQFLWRLERLSWRIMMIFIACVCLLTLMWWTAWPTIAESIIRMVPVSVERTIGTSVLVSLDKVLFKPSALTAARQEKIRRAMNDLVARAQMGAPPEIIFRAAPEIGANALALPGGLVVMTDEMVHLLQDRRQILAVLAHEWGHVHERHGLRQLVQMNGLYIMSAILAGDASAVETLSKGMMTLIGLSYTRDFERDADDFAVRALDASGIGRKSMIEVFEKFQAHCGKGCDKESWLSTHPALSARINRVHEHDASVHE